ncbi:MAG: hypothetical protein ABEI31_11125 [Halodesulfurarchaeum sp.]
MSETASSTTVLNADRNWQTGAIAGFIAGLPFGILIQFVVGAMGAVGALWGFPMNIAAGWVIHLLNSVIFGLVFAFLVSFDVFEPYRDSWLSAAGLGLVYGAVLWFVNIGFVWPIWLGAVGFPPGPAALPVPYFAVKPLIGHLVYGVVLGALYPVTATRV